MYTVGRKTLLMSTIKGGENSGLPNIFKDFAGFILDG